MDKREKLIFNLKVFGIVLYLIGYGFSLGYIVAESKRQFKEFEDTNEKLNNDMERVKKMVDFPRSYIQL